MSTATAERTTDRYPTRHAPEPTVIGRAEPVVWGNADGGLCTQADLDRFEATGYLSVESLIDTDEVETLRAELRRLSADDTVRADERTVIEPESEEVRSIFEVHKISPVVADLLRDERIAGRARQLLGSEVYVHQSRINFKPGFAGKEFSWHSDFETWHAEDGMPAMRALSFSIALTDNFPYNGPLMIMPGSHREFLTCVGETPTEHYKESLRRQEIGTPDADSLTALADRHGIDVLTGSAGGATIFDCNCMHGSNGNITPYPRSNVFVVFNSVDNACVEPFAADQPRPGYIGAREFTPIR
jgi:ectoine hydroxylase